MAKAGTPSRLQAASVPVAPRVPLHSLAGTLAGKLLASLPAGTSMCPQEDASAVSEAVLELDSTTATDLTLTASEVLFTPPLNRHRLLLQHHKRSMKLILQNHAAAPVTLRTPVTHRTDVEELQ